LLLAWFISGCSEEGGFDCFMPTGEVKKEPRYVSAFHFIEIHDNINLFLTQDTLVNKLEVEAGENLLPGITTEVENGHLYLRNENTCNWVRKFDIPVNVYISFSRLDSMIFRAAGDLTFTTPWQNDSIQFDVWEGAGNIDLKLDVFKSRVYVHYGVVSIVMSGNSQVSYLSNKGYGPVDAQGLFTKYSYLNTLSPNDCIIWAENEIGVTIDNIGNVYYKGDPAVINKQLNSSGRLIRLD
jgi:hypothetical protein